jgi:quercetin dioxygenase-like cupin family protein
MSSPGTPGYAPGPQAVRRVLLENAEVAVIETTYPQGSSVPMHVHRFPHALYVIEGGSVEVTGQDGSVTTFDVSPGQILWHSPQSHGTRNIGSTTVRIVEIEIKHAATEGTEERAPRAVLQSDLDWLSDPLDPTRRVALLEGDPAGPGPYTLRGRMAAGYALGLHQHPDEDEHLTVLSGTLHWSAGAAGSGEAEHALPAGAYIVFPAGTPHRLWTTEETVIQMSGVGPRAYVYLDPAEDPRVKHHAAALEATEGVKVIPLAKETTSWDGRPIVYPQGEAEMTALLVEIAPGAQTGWHHHVVPNFAYMLQGELELTLDDGRVRLLRAGDELPEVVNRPHNGRNVGKSPVKLVVFYAGTVGTPLSVKEKKSLLERTTTEGFD